MKKLLVLFLGLSLILPSFANNHNKEIVVENKTSVLSNSSSSVVDLLVYANQAVDDLCNYFNGSWVDVGLTLYCTFGGDVYTCTAYKVVQATCVGSEAVRLYIEGDIEGAIKKTLQGSAKIYSVSKIGGKFKISEKNNMTPRSGWR